MMECRQACGIIAWLCMSQCSGVFDFRERKIKPKFRDHVVYIVWSPPSPHVVQPRPAPLGRYFTRINHTTHMLCGLVSLAVRGVLFVPSVVGSPIAWL
jgi:hypothetical protein